VFRSELVVDEESGVVRGLLVKVSNRVIRVDLESVHAFGQDAVTLRELPENNSTSEAEASNWFDRVLGKPLLSDDGVDMGTIDDLCFDEQSGTLLGFQVSGGLIQDLTEGKELLPLGRRITYGEDAVILHGN